MNNSYYLERLRQKLTKHTQRFAYGRTVVGVVAGIGYPLYYFFWTELFPQDYESIWLRFSAGFLSALLLTSDYWPIKAKKWIPLYWHFLIIYLLPFCFSYLILHNNFALVYHLSLIVAFTFVAIFAEDIILAVSRIVIGVGSGTALFYLTSDFQPDYYSQISTLPLYLFALFGGNIFVQQYIKASAHHERLEGLLSATGNLAHELRTPLLSIRMGADALEKFLPELFRGYQAACSKELIEPELRASQQQRLANVLTTIKLHTQLSNSMITNLLDNAKQHKNDHGQFIQFSMAPTVEQALTHYPFRTEHERMLVTFEKPNIDFNVYGSQSIMIQILYNLIRNALYAIQQADKGAITISMECGEKANILRFTDTGAGMDKKTLNRIFERFFTTKIDSTGIGLSFCRNSLAHIGARIECQSTLGQYTEFTLTFPKIHD